MKPISSEVQMKSNTDQESHTSWFRRIFSKTPTPAATPEAAAPVVADAPQKPARHQKVLIVDDDPLFLKITTTQLSNEGFDVLTAKDGCEAIEVARKQKPNLLLLDVNLPQDVTGVPWDGHRVVSWLRHFESLKHIPIVMTSGGDPVKNTRDAMNSGATAFFHKRMSQTHLLTLVNHSLLRGTAKSGPSTDGSFQI
jgi:CheY-like chemotaxis protein